ncbi:MAG: hypothetical protein COT85_01970 [Chlamydiae bacterium CG10_big_fil_rev_8_21_14_0_10_42_34]|nr:MAG: hypothetical protein COT85_01970 [Chlamydiae bacterium CG10_big_fil_rev_8_21_14_0_10_42_34]
MKSLKIQNLILVKHAEIHFGKALNILTGETGSGKSAILSAIRLISGERADVSCIRNGSDFAVIEAVLEGPIFIRREIHRSGKNRCFIDDQQVNLSTLKEKTNIEMVDQSSSSTIFSKQKQMLDTFANLTNDVKAFEHSYSEEKAIEFQLDKLQQIPKERELEWAQKDLSLIEETNWQPAEEEKLAEEHHFLTHAQELAEKMSSIAFLLNEGTELTALKRAHTMLDQCVRVDQKLAIASQTMKSALLELDEVAQEVQSYSERLDGDPKRLAYVESRIAAIESLKRRFGSEIKQQKEKLIETIDHLTHLDAQIAELQSQLELIKEKNLVLADSITSKRKEYARPFALNVLEELKNLNIPHAQFEIEVGTAFGDVQFLFSANAGVQPIPLEQCASGGELSRLLLAIKTILSDGESTLVFDEIDSNVGGHTAAVLGQKLKRLAEKRQVICVTHFVQVAKLADDHFLVSKNEENGNTYTTIAKLSDQEKEIEYHRMLGDKEPASTCQLF